MTGSNVMVSFDENGAVDEVKLVDFDLCSCLGESLPVMRPDRPTIPIGTLQYLVSEQHMDGRNAHTHTRVSVCVCVCAGA